jgi:hypothetical protein
MHGACSFSERHIPYLWSEFIDQPLVNLSNHHILWPMIPIHPQYIKDPSGKRSLVVLPAKEFNAMIEELEMQEDVRLYDAAMADHGTSLPIDDAFALIEAKRSKRK